MILTGCWFYAQLHGIVFIFFLYVDNRLHYSMCHGVDDHYPCAREQKRDNGPEQGQLFFVGQGSVSFVGAIIQLPDIL